MHRPTHADDDIRNLRLLRVLGTGGCSTVYAGTLHGLEVRGVQREGCVCHCL